MSTRQYAITIYVHPDAGPILPIQIDMMQVEIIAQKAPAPNRNEVRINEVANQIKQCFPRVKPESQRQGIAAIIARLENLALFSGIVLRLPGSIDEESPATTKKIDSLVKDVGRLRGEATQLREQFERERGERELIKGKLSEAVSAGKRLLQEREEAQKRVSYLQAQLRQAQEDATCARQDADRSEREKAQLQTRLDFQQDNTTNQQVTDLLAQLAQARKDADQFKKEKEQLQTSLEWKDDEIKRLRQGGSGNERKELDELRSALQKCRNEYTVLEEKYRRLVEEPVPPNHNPFLE